MQALLRDLTTSVYKWELGISAVQGKEQNKNFLLEA